MKTIGGEALSDEFVSPAELRIEDALNHISGENKTGINESTNFQRCPNCNLLVFSGDEKCLYCGRNLPTRVCPYCQHTIPKFEDPCHFCRHLEPAVPIFTNQPNSSGSKFYLVYLFVIFFVNSAAMIVRPDAQPFGVYECGPDKDYYDLTCLLGMWSEQTGFFLVALGVLVFGWMGISKLRRDQEKNWE